MCIKKWYSNMVTKMTPIESNAFNVHVHMQCVSGSCLDVYTCSVLHVVVPAQMLISLLGDESKYISWLVQITLFKLDHLSS